MKITQVMLSEGWGGAERLFVELCTGLARYGHDIQAICRSSFTRGDMLTGIPGIALVNVPARGNWDLLSARQIENSIRSFSPEIIHSHLSRATWMAGRAGKKLNIPVVTTTHNRIKPKYFKNVDYFSTITEDLKRYLVGFGVDEDRVKTIPNFSRFTPVAAPPAIVREPPVFISFGRFVQKKGYRYLIEAFARFSSEWASSKLLIGGSGPLEGTLTGLVMDLGLGDNVEFTGWVEDAEEFLQRGDIFVLPSLDEPFGIVVLEAMARGKPIVSTVTSGPAEILDDSTAYFARPGDSQDLYETMRTAAEDDTGRALKAQRALDLFKSNYTLEKILPVFMDYYSSLAADMTKGSENPKTPLP
ncbi:MAG: glycosyltransferase family 4 protein [bacterium]|nr:glycosyltransferase family 4 protein [bacterium]MDT8365275.1 glycosyltransferase family 4 protein [bacterium]